MIIEGKQKIWADYQKDIPDDHYFYVRSCIRQAFFPGSEVTFLDITRNKLGKDFYENPYHTTCGGIAYHSDTIPQETAMTIIDCLVAHTAYVYNTLLLLYHLVRMLYRDLRDLARVPRVGGQDSAISLGFVQKGVRQAEISRPCQRPYL